jgi:hypothetical protein
MVKWARHIARKAGFLCGLVVALACVWSTATAQVAMDPSLYPARLTAIRFSGGYVLSHGTPLDYGNWTVRFPSRTVVARYHPSRILLGRQTEANIQIPLVCSNSVDGTGACLMTLQPDHDQCTLHVNLDPPAGQTSNNNWTFINIECPLSFNFAP